MSLSSEDRPFLRDLFHEIRDVQRETNALLEEIRDLLKSPPVTVEQTPTAQYSIECTCDGRSAAICQVPGHRRR